MDRIKVVDAEKSELDVKYCIPEWLRDEQVKLSCTRIKDRLQPSKGLRGGSVALVCFGPSLNNTWRGIRKHEYIISCSGAHKFLREKGIIPDWHVEVDPRAHKVELIGDDIHPHTEFLIASCCHPALFRHLEDHGAKITLWHTYSGEKKDTLPLVYPQGEWVSTGGANVGLRALVLARLLGFINIHIFGMDGSFPVDSKLKHASEHPNTAPGHIIATYNDKEYATTTAFLQCARSTFHELEMLPDVTVYFYGHGLIQDMAQKKLPDLERKKKAHIAFRTLPTISAGYVQQNKELHQTNPMYGISALKHIPIIKALYNSIKGTSLLDYGCGKGMLAKNLDFPIWEYDPAIEGKDKLPRAADLVACIDVLEHIEPEYLDSVLQDLVRCTIKIGYFVISPKAAMKTLPDGRNTHLIIQNKTWWKFKINKYFDLIEGGIFERDDKLIMVVAPRAEKLYKANTFTLAAVA